MEMPQQENPEDPSRTNEPIINSPNDAGYQFRKVLTGELEEIRKIDRAEKILESYVYRDGQLALVPDDRMVSGFDAAELRMLIERQTALMAAGGIVVGAFEQGELIGIASIERKRSGTLLQYCKMDILYTSRLYRGKHIGIQLLDIIKKIALDFGAQKLYISATPTKYTVDFYLSQGASLTTELDEELFALEPDDIHLELVL
jgi:GNAT superfamily N-acetyltransferase